MPCGGGAGVSLPGGGGVPLAAALFLLLVTVSLLSTHGASACFIRNCPLGGKRSLSPASQTVSSPMHAPHRECLRCGPGGLGQCIGPNICCGRAIGCFINSAETAECRREDDIPTPCRVEGATCGGQQGHCVADGVCCSDERCRLDGTCLLSGPDVDVAEAPPSVMGRNEDSAATGDFPVFSSSPVGRGDLTPELLTYVKRLLAARAEAAGGAYRRK